MSSEDLERAHTELLTNWLFCVLLLMSSQTSFFHNGEQRQESTWLSGANTTISSHAAISDSTAISSHAAISNS